MTTAIKKIIVSLQFDAADIELGELISDNRLIYFRYFPSFIKRGLEISPLKLKLNSEVNKANDTPFDGIFGVFADSMPDGWGRLLLDRALTAKGIALNTIGVLDRHFGLIRQCTHAIAAHISQSVKDANGV